MNRFGSHIVVATLLTISCFMHRHALAVEPIDTPPPVYSTPESSGGAQPFLSEDCTDQGVRIFSAVLTRRFGPVEEPAPQFFALRNGQEPGFDWSAGLNGWGWGFGSAFPRFGFASPGFGFGLVGYNRFYYRPWYAYPGPQVWSDRFPWYSPGGVGPNIYQPWYLQRNALPWYSPFGIGPNIYTPNSTWQSYYPWYSPNGPGPNNYTPWWQYGGCLYW